MTRDDPRRQARDLWRAVARLREERGDVAGAAAARRSAKILGTGVKQLGWHSRVGHYARSTETGRWRRRA